MAFISSSKTDLVDLGNYIMDLNHFASAQLVEQSGVTCTGITLKNGEYHVVPNEFIFHKLKEYCRVP